MNISQATIEVLIEAFREHLHELLDDPAWVQDDCPDYIRARRRAATELSLDFDSLLLELGTKFEVERLLALEQGRPPPDLYPRRPLKEKTL